MDESNRETSVVGSKRSVNSSDAGWRDLVRRVAAGDEQAISELYDVSSRLVYSVALRILGAAADAEEVTLDVYTQIWRSAGSFDPARGTVTAWLVNLARSRAIDRLRSAASRARREHGSVEFFDLADQTADPEMAAASRQQRKIVLAALEELGAEQREAIGLAYFSDLSHSEIAGRLGLPLGTIKTRIRLGMMKLRDHLGPHAADAGRMA